jgi:hypothetical protein
LPEAQGIAAGIAERQKVKFRLRWVYPWRRFIRAQRIRAELGNVRAVAQRGPLASFGALQGYGRPRAVAK